MDDGVSHYLYLDTVLSVYENAVCDKKKTSWAVREMVRFALFKLFLSRQTPDFRAGTPRGVIAS